MIISPQRIFVNKVVKSSEKPMIDDQFQPNGIDVRVDTIKRIGALEDKFTLTKDDKKKSIPLYDTILVNNMYILKKFHAYSMECFESVVVPDGMVAMVYGRSTLNRAGLFLRSSIYDSGFVCDKIGFTMYSFNDCVIERESRVAQIVFYESYPNFLYNGQYQGKL